MTLRRASMAEAQRRYDYLSPPDDEDGLQECAECKATGEIDGDECPFCQGKLFFLGDEPTTRAEYERLISEDSRYE